MKAPFPSFLRIPACGALALLLAALPPLHAQSDETNESSAAAAKEMDETAAKQGDAKVITRLTTDFSTLAGSPDNAKALVTGLRDGTPITFTTTVNGTPQSTVIKPATGKLGYGNVYLSLSLAQAELTKNGITNPTPEQLQTALNGGSITIASKPVAFPGILALRASGEGWGQIAKSLDLRLGSVVSEMRSARGQLERGERPENAVKAGKPDRAEKSDKPEKPALPERANRPETPVRPEMPDHPARPELPERAVRPELPERANR